MQYKYLNVLSRSMVLVHEPNPKFLHIGIKLVNRHIIYQNVGNLLENQKINVNRHEEVVLC